MASSDPFTPCPFQINIPDEEIARMRRLISDTRLPDSPPVGGASWGYGIELEWFKTMREAWLNDFDWKLVETEMNSIPQFTAVIESVTVHFMYQKSSRADAVPILFLHGWPGSFWGWSRC